MIDIEQFTAAKKRTYCFTTADGNEDIYDNVSSVQYARTPMQGSCTSTVEIRNGAHVIVLDMSRFISVSYTTEEEE